MKTTKALSQWWIQFPEELRKITICRFLASIGAGGVIYFTALVFNNLSFTATQIGIGFCFAAVSGTLARLTAGFWLDKSMTYSSAIFNKKNISLERAQDNKYKSLVKLAKINKQNKQLWRKTSTGY